MGTGGASAPPGKSTVDFAGRNFCHGGVRERRRTIKETGAIEKRGSKQKKNTHIEDSRENETEREKERERAKEI